MTRITFMGSVALLGLGLYFATAGSALSEPVVFSTSAGAIRGYDPVAYFSEGRAVKGQREFKYEWSGAVWFFSSRENLGLFRQEPARYAPQYGGYCAFAMSKGSHAPSDPHAWTIHDDKLYLNYSKSVRRTWSKNIPLYIKRADRHWTRLHPEPRQAPGA